ncbi:hypothetical protein DPMN_143163 [Dreissena polymorpha]|uniref:Uncharacterized protein n=1 Tax=Dreissena polymorpha TaxID=45954 RepID=A0A9D4GD48_DREPO|nr:hypothetical protein DPMN_143163 [Dreissena polymorpha]
MLSSSSDDDAVSSTFVSISRGVLQNVVVGYVLDYLKIVADAGVVVCAFRRAEYGCQSCKWNIIIGIVRHFLVIIAFVDSFVFFPEFSMLETALVLWRSLPTLAFFAVICTSDSLGCNPRSHRAPTLRRSSRSSHDLKKVWIGADRGRSESKSSNLANYGLHFFFFFFLFLVCHDPATLVLSMFKISVARALSSPIMKTLQRSYCAYEDSTTFLLRFVTISHVFGHALIVVVYV